MATTAVDIVVKANTSALSKLDRGLKGSQDKIDKLATKLNGDIPRGLKTAGSAGATAGRKIQQGFTSAGNAAAKFGKSLSGLRAQLLGLGVGAGLTKSFLAASDLETAQTRVQNLGRTYTQLAGIQETALKSAEKFRISNVEAINSYVDLGNRLGEQGASVQDLQNVFEGLNTVFAINKTSAQEAASAQLQLNQALGSGRLAGEEFNAINEATPQVISEVARVLGVARGEVKKLASEGQVSSQVLIQALTNIRATGASQLEGAFDGSFGALKEFNKAIEEFSQAVGTELLPAITPIIKGATELLEKFGQLPKPVRTAAVAITAIGVAAIAAAPAIAVLAKGATALLSALGVAKLGAAAAGVGKLGLAVTGLKVAFVALTGPVGLAIAAVTALGVAIYKTAEAQRQFDDLIENGAGTIDDLTAAKTKLEQKLNKVRDRLAGTGGEMKATGRDAARLRKEVRELQAQLEQIERTYTVRLRLKREGFTFGDDGNVTSFSVAGVGRFDANGVPIKDAAQEVAAPSYPDALKASDTDLEKKTKKAKGRIKKEKNFADQEGRALANAEEARAQALFEKKMALAEQEFQVKKQYQEKLNRLAQLSLPSGAQGPFGTLIAISTDQAALDERERELKNLITEAERALEAARNAPVSSGMMGTPISGGGGRYIEGGYGPNGPNHYGAHFDIKKMTGGAYYDRNALDKYVRVNGMPLSSGVTVPGGEFGAPRSYGPHAGWDYAFGGGAALTLQNGAKFTSSQNTAYGDATAFQTPDGNIYKIIHGTFEPGPPGDGNVTMDQSGAISQAGSVDAATTKLQGAQEALKQFQEQRDKLSGADFLIRQAEFTQVFKDQTEEINKSTEAMKLRTGLELEGVRPEVIDGELKKLEVSRLLNNNVQALDKALENKNITQEQYNQLLAESKRLAGENVAAIEAETAALTQANDALKVKQQTEQLAGQISGAITGALGDVIKGTKSVEEAFSDMLTNIGNMFIDMAMKILQDAITQQLVGLFSGLLGGGFGGGSPVPSMGSGLPLNGFADGGYVTSPQIAQIGEGGQPEYVIPASDMNGAMKRWNSGQRGDAVINGPEPMTAGSDGGNGMAGTSTIDVKYSISEINSVRYVSEEQFQQGMSQAAAQGAKMGEARTLGRLKGNPSARRSIGL